MNNKYIIIYVIISIILLSYLFIRYSRKRIELDDIPKYLINLDRRPDRLKTTNMLLKEWGYNDIIRYSAVDGSKITKNELVELVDPNSLAPIYKKQRTQHDELSIGAVGCYLSHCNLWNEIENSIYDSAVIFEDDTKPSLTKHELNKILSNCPSDWDVILFGGYYNIKDDFNDNKYYKVNQFFCLHAYMINKRAIKKIKPHLYPIKIQVDWVLSNLSKDNKLNIYAIKNSKWYQNIDVNSTDIQTPVVVN